MKRVTEVRPGPLLPPDGTPGQRLLRRIRGIAIELVGFVVVTVLLPVLMAVAAIVDLVLWLARRKRPMAIRLVPVLWWFLLGEVRALASLAWLWVRAGGPRGIGSERRRIGVYNLRIRWASRLLGAARVLFGLRIEVEGIELAERTPYLFMIRHASIIDNLVGDALIARPWGIGMRYVVKRELEVLPPIDIGGRWIPTNFLQRGAADSAAEIDRMRRLGENLGPGEMIAIYPEGTRFTPKKLARVKEILRERRPGLAELAEPLVHLLPPRLGGPLALLEETEGLDVVLCGHVGFDGFQHIRDIWAGGLLGRTIKVKLWRYPASELPATEEERTRWLFDRWLELDRWVADHDPAGALGAAPASPERAVLER